MQKVFLKLDVQAAHDGKEKVLEKVREILAATSNVRELLTSTKTLVKERLGLVKENLKELKLICKFKSFQKPQF